MPQIETEKLEQYAQQVFDRLNYFNDYVLQTIGRRIKKTGELSAHDQQALKNMADISGDMDRITKELAKITEQNIYDVEQLYTQVMTDSVDTYRPLYDYKKITFIPFSENEFAQQLVRNWTVQTAGEMINLSRTKALCFDQYDARGTVVGSTPLQGAFQKAIDDAVIAVSSGTVDFHTAMRETVKNLGGSGVKVHYGSGVNRSLSAMVRQNLLYGAKQSAQAYDEYAGKELGCNGFEVDAHAGCRPSHMFMQGQMYSYRGTVRIGGKTYIDGTEALERLKDYNCLHFKIDVILGVSQPRYSKAELDRIQRETTDMIEYNGQKKTLYEWKQTQRKMERVVRNETAVRDMAAASGDRTLVKDCNAKIGAYRAKYDELCGQVKGLEPRLDRMASYRGKSLTSSGKSGMINLSKKDNIFKKITIEDLKVEFSQNGIREIADKYGISISGKHFVIESNEEHFSVPFYGRTDTIDIGRIDLYPRAFLSEEDMARTLIHEHAHFLQLKKYGKNYCEENVFLMEKEAYKFEDLWYQILKKRNE